MLGNRNKLKMGLLVVALLTSSLGFGAETPPVLEKAHIAEFKQATVDFADWAHRLFTSKIVSFPDFLKELKDSILHRLAKLKAQVPDVPPANAKFKKMVDDLCDALTKIHHNLSHAKTIMQLQKASANDCSLQQALDRAKNDLDDLISYIDKHPEAYAPEAVDVLKEYRSKTFQKIYNKWHKTTPAQWFAALAKYLRMF